MFTIVRSEPPLNKNNSNNKNNTRKVAIRNTAKNIAASNKAT